MNMKINNTSFYKTSDLALVALLSLSFPIKEIDSSDTKRVSFIFESSNALNEQIQAYWLKMLRVEPQEYFNQLKNIKTRIYSNK